VKKKKKLVAGLLGAEPVVVLGRRAAALGVEAHLVGGAVRDALLGRESHDYDVTVSGRGRELAEGVAREMGARFVPLGGRDFASFRVVAARREGEEEPAWELDVWDREGGSLAADLARRDFTINSIAVALGEDGGGTASLVDPFGGVEDLAHRRLRATTAESFRDDPLRVLRLPRFLVQLPGFEAESATVELARRAVPGLARVAGERVRDELTLILCHERAHRGVEALLEVGVYPALWLGRPASAETSAVEDAAVEGATRAVGRVARLEERAAEIGRLAPGAPPVDLLAARWALTFVAATATEPAVLVERFRDAGYLTPGLATRVKKLLAEPEIPSDERGRRRFLHRLGDAWPTAVSRLGAGLEDEVDERALAEWRQALRELAALLAADGERIIAPPRLLSGEDVQRLLGVPPGPEVGRALDRIRRAQVEGEIANREEAERLLRGG
jgi:poly(A) polymerase